MLPEQEPILGMSPSRPRKAATTTRILGRGILINRYALLLVLAGISVGGWYLQHEIIDLGTSLASEQTKVHTLSDQLAVHEQVIQRFNSSITNTDVMDRLSHLEIKFNKTEEQLKDQLVRTQATIQAQLESTVQELSTTVAKAELEISTEVDKVKVDVEHYVITTQDQFSMENSFMVYQLAGTFTLISCLISMWHMTAHLRKLNQPDVQRKILAILWMSPIYAVTSWFSLVFHSAEGYLAIFKDGYEAYIIYQFLSFCIAVLGKGDRNKVVDLLERHADHLTPPFRLFGCCEYVCGCCKPEPYESTRALADAILLQCQFFAMQFVLFRPLTTTAMVVLGKLEYYGAGDGPTDYRSPQFYITIIQNLSIFTAFTGLLKFYHAVDKDLAWCRPFAKFLCIKGVVFMTFWQGLAISVLAQTTSVGGQDQDEWAKSAQNFLICLEMLLFSIAHFYCFPTDEWEEGYRVKHQHGQFGDSIALGDFFQDVKLILQSKPAKKRRKRSDSPPKGISSGKLHTLPELGEDEEAGERTGSSDSDDEYHRPSEHSDVPTDLNKEISESFDSTEDGEEYDEEDYDYDGEEDFDNDEEKGLSQKRYDDMSPDDRFIARALEKSLGLAGDDADIAEATRRLLESKILSPDFFRNELGDDDEISRDDTNSYEEDEEDATDDNQVELESEGMEEVGKEGNVISHKEHGDEHAVTEEAGVPKYEEVKEEEGGGENDQAEETGSGLHRHDRAEAEPYWTYQTTDGEVYTPPPNIIDQLGSGDEPPPSNERTPLLTPKKSAEPSPSSSTPLRPSIFTTVADMAVASDDEEARMTPSKKKE